MKISRPGNTELNLMLIQFCLTHINDLTKNELYKINIQKRCYIDWIYKTAGYYDKNIPVKNRYDLQQDYTQKLDNFINKMVQCLSNSDLIYTVGLDILIKNKHPLIKYLENFEKYYNIKLIPKNISVKNCIPYIINKKILIISPFKELIETQISNKYVYKLHPILINTTFTIYKFPYLFFNNGPHNDSFETLEYLKEDIKMKCNDFDIALLSCGCYGGFLVDMIHQEMKKDAIYVGGELPLLFGIVGKRHLSYIKELFNDDTQYLIVGVPDEFKPTNYDKIENGCYW